MRSRERELMVELQLAARGVSDPRVLAAMATVDREPFVPVDHADDAYADLDVPVGYGQVAAPAGDDRAGARAARAGRR